MSDNIGTKLIVAGGELVKTMIHEIVCWSFNTGKFPEVWKANKVVAIPTPDGTFRPITVVNTCSKVLEHYIYDELLNHLEKTEYWNNNQFGSGRNTLQNTLCWLCKILY